jgi:hypothetical protein
MARVGDLIIVHLVEAFDSGLIFNRSAWPLHITLIPWFKCKNKDMLSARLHKTSARISAFTAMVADEQMFGPNKNIAVNVFQTQTQLRDLHEKLADSLKVQGVEFQESHYMFDKFRAHITRQTSDNRHKDPGDEINVDNFCLAELISPTECIILEQFKLT